MKMTTEEIITKYGHAQTEWDRLDTHKRGLKDNLWRQCAELTIPTLYFANGTTESYEIKTNYNSLGADCVNRLSSKLTEALLPQTGNFFRLLPFSEIKDTLTPEQLLQLDTELSKTEQTINTLIGIQGLTTPLYEAVKLLIVLGNTLLYKKKSDTFIVYNPRDYCVERDFSGNPMTVIIKSSIDTRLLPAEFHKNEKKEGEKEEYETEDIYTCVYRIDSKRWIAYQEVDDKVLESTIVYYTNDTVPYIPLRWSFVHNEDYGRGLVELFLGDLRSLENITKGIVESASIAIKTLFGIPGGVPIKPKDLSDAKNGDIIIADLSKVTKLQSEKSTDLNIAFKLQETIEARINRAFLNFQARDSERTTMAEIRATVKELDAAFGGTYAVLARDLQVPLLKILLSEVSTDALKYTTPSIITGANSISREKDIENLNSLMQGIAVFGPEIISKYLKVDSYISELAKSLGIDANKIVKSQEEQAQEQQAAMEAEQQAAMQQEQTAQLPAEGM